MFIVRRSIAIRNTLFVFISSFGIDESRVLHIHATTTTRKTSDERTGEHDVAQYINILLINDAMCECVNVSHTNSCRNVCMCMSVHTSCIEHFSLGKCISSTIGHFINDDNRIFHCMCYFNIIGHFCIFSFTSLLFDKYVVMRHKMIFSYIYIYFVFM